MNFVAVRETRDWTAESWTTPSSVEELTAFPGWRPRLAALFARAGQVFKWGLFDRDPLELWGRGRVTLLGDAAHPMLPFLAQGAAQATEDAYALAAWLSARSGASQEALADRSHLLFMDVNLGMHAKDVADLILWEDLEDVVLVGHSYGGAVISAAIELAAPRIASAMLLDALLPRSGESIADLSPAAQGRIREMEANGTVSIPPTPARAFAVNECDQAWVDAKCTPQPLRTFLDRSELTGARDRVRRKLYVRGSRYAAPTFDIVLDRLWADTSWATHSLPCRHDMMIDWLRETADLMLRAA